jgi:hypothetical protein
LPDIYPPARQREALLKLVEALGCRDKALRRDECSDWRINGRWGHIYAVPGMTAHGLAPGEGFQLCFRGAPEFEEPPKGSKALSFARQAMSFAETALDGDGEGVMFLHRLPTAAEAEIIRDKFGIPKKREISDEERARLAGMGHRFAARGDDVEEAAVSPGSPSDDDLVS